MGGNAFLYAVAAGHPSVHTPRMSNETYSLLKGIYQQRLEKYFEEHYPGTVDIRTAAPLPQKESHGDIDFVVGKPRDGTADFLELASAVGAAAVMSRGPAICSLAVADDGSIHQGPTISYKEGPLTLHGKPGSPAPQTPETYAQIDVEIVSSEDMQWLTWSNSYGDLGGIVGNITTNLGLTINHHGIVLRFLELERARAAYPTLGVSQEESQLLLTKDPYEAMRFLGMDTEPFTRGFSTINDLYAWLTTCSLLNPEALKLRRIRHRNSDNQKLRKRPVFTNFFRDYLPSRDARFAWDTNDKNHPNSTNDPPTTSQLPNAESTDPLSSPSMLRHREAAKNAALHFFPHQRLAYETKLTRATHQMRTNIACELLRPVVEAASGKKGKNSTEIVRALRRFVNVDEDGGLGVSAERLEDGESELGRLVVERGGKWVLRDEVRVGRWVAERWEEVRGLERTRAREGRVGCEGRWVV